MKTVQDIPQLNSKVVVVRADMDVPHDGDVLRDDYRIRQSMPTIKYLLEHGAKVIVLSKIGRPKKSFDPAESLAPAAKRLAELLEYSYVATADVMPAAAPKQLVFLSGDIRNADIQAGVKSAPQGSLTVLENIRFYPEEENCDPGFAKMLASLGDVYVNEAFAMDHRAEVSVSMLPKIIPGYAGFQLAREVQAMDKVMTLPSRPFIAIMGGAKISDKIETIRNLAQQADAVLIGGALANLFQLAKGYDIGVSYCEKEKVALAAELLRNFKDKIHLPTDAVAAFADGSTPHIAGVTALKPDEGMFDIGPETILEYATIIKTAKKLVWNGPLGKFEEKQFSTGTMSVARVFAGRCKGFAYGVVGGGDTIDAINQAGIADQIDFVSTGGGAMLEYLAGKKLPGIIALQ